MSTPTEHELIQVARDNWNDNPGMDSEALQEAGFDTKETLPATIERIKKLGGPPVQQLALLGEGGESGQSSGEKTSPMLEVVTASHTPQPSARHEPRYSRRRKARTTREKRIADQPPVSQQVTPHGHDPIMTIHNDRPPVS